MGGRAKKFRERQCADQSGLSGDKTECVGRSLTVQSKAWRIEYREQPCYRAAGAFLVIVARRSPAVIFTSCKLHVETR